MLLKDDKTFEGAKSRITKIGHHVGRVAQAEEIVADIDRIVERVQKRLKAKKGRPKVLFVFAHGAGTLMIGGEGTSVSEVLELAGGRNAVPGIEDYRPLTSEAVVGSAPDVILVTQRSLASLGGMKGLMATPGIALTPAGRDRRVVVMDDLLLLGIGPRMGQAVETQHRHLHPDDASDDASES